jgi:hypothetical protein
MSYLIVLDSELSFLKYLPVAKKLGLRVCFLSTEFNVSQEIKKQFDIFIETRELTPDVVVKSLKDCGILESVCLFWTLNVVAVGLCHKLNSELLGNNKFSIDLANKTQNKYLLRKGLEGSTYNPEFFVLECDKEQRNPFPNTKCVIKPFLGYESIGVQLVRSANEFSSAFRKSASILNQFDERSLAGSNGDLDASCHLLVEQFIEGPEYSLEIFGIDGKLLCLSICQKSPMKEPFFEELSYQMPASLDAFELQRLGEEGCRIMSALGMKSGIAHLEVIDSPFGVKALDVGLRIGGGGLTHQLMHIATGLNLVEACLLEALGHDPTPALVPTKARTALLYLYQVREGGTVRNIPDAKSLELPREVQLMKSQIFVKVGQQLSGYPSFSGLPGYALFELNCQDRQAAEIAISLLSRCESELKITYKTDF